MQEGSLFSTSPQQLLFVGLLMVQINISTEKKIMDLENRLMAAKGEGEAVGWMGSLGLLDANYCLWGLCLVALGTMSSHL